LLQHLRVHGLSRQGQPADRLRGRFHQDRHVPPPLRRARPWCRLRRPVRPLEERAMNIDYTGKSVLVVGGTSGIGAGIVAAFAAAGATVTATGATQKEVDAAPRNASLHVLDVRDNAAVKAFVGALPSLD